MKTMIEVTKGMILYHDDVDENQPRNDDRTARLLIARGTHDGCIVRFSLAELEALARAAYELADRIHMERGERGDYRRDHRPEKA